MEDVAAGGCAAPAVEGDLREEAVLARSMEGVDSVEEDVYRDPGQEVGTAGKNFVAALANVLTHLASLAGRPQRVTRFHAIRAPQLSIHDYLMRIATYFQCSHECFVLALVYIDRIVKLHPEFTICNLNIHRLLVTSVMLAAKFFDDVYYSNSYYARVGGVRKQEMNALEKLFLHLIEYRLHVLPQEYEQYRNHVLTAVRGGGNDSGSGGSGASGGAVAAPAASAGIGLAPYQHPTSEPPWGARSGEPPQPQGPAPGLSVPREPTLSGASTHATNELAEGLNASTGSGKTEQPGEGPVVPPAT